MNNQYTLHKLSEGFIITSDENIRDSKVNNYIYCEWGIGQLKENGLVQFEECAVSLSIIKNYHRIIAQQDQIIFSSLKEEEQKKIGWFDVEELASKLADKEEWDFDSPYGNGYEDFKIGAIKMFQKAQELLSDRIFTLEDMRKAFEKGLVLNYDYCNGDECDKFIQSLSQKSWQVELEMETATASAILNGYKIKPKLTNGKVTILKILNKAKNI